MTVLLTDATLHNVFQWLSAYGIRTQEALSLAAELDEVGFFSLEVGDNAGFYLSSYYLGEDPWDRLKTIRQKVTKTPLQITLLQRDRVDDRKFSDKGLEEFIQLAVKAGVSIFRVYDTLNEVINLATIIKAVKNCGAAVQGAVLFSVRPQSSQDYAALTAELERLGCDSACILDAAGSLSPAVVSDLVKSIKSELRIPLALHSQSTQGIAPLTFFAAAIAGVDILDTAFTAFNHAASQPSTESMAAALKGTPYDTGLELSKIDTIGAHFAALSEKYRSLLAAGTVIQSDGLLSRPIPSEILSILARQLTDMKEDIRKQGLRYEEVIQMAAKFSPAATSTPDSPREFNIELEGETFNVKIASVTAQPAAVEKPRENVPLSKGSVISPMPGVVLSINVKVGACVSEGDLVATVEAMKMHYEVYAAWSGIVTQVLCSEGDMVEAETVLIVVEPGDK